MSSVDIVRKTKVRKSFRVQQISGMFDVPDKREIIETWHVDMPISEREWNIGLIVGPSGCGKTTVASEIFKDAYHHANHKWSDAAIVDDFGEDLSVRQITRLLTSVGLSSPPHWLKPYAHLSNGQKFRCELAMAMAKSSGNLVFDEFTSVVDRDVAKICSSVVQKTVRRDKTKFVAVSCHYDILDWLQPDWVYDPSTGEFQWRRLRQRPKIDLRIQRIHHSGWSVFAKHHYLSSQHNAAAICFAATWNKKPVAWSSWLHFAHPKVKNRKREHRTVVLPDYQGIGIGNAVSEHVAQMFTENGFECFSRCSHPSFIHHRTKSNLWKLNAAGATGSGSGSIHNVRNKTARRVTASFSYVGQNKGR